MLRLVIFALNLCLMGMALAQGPSARRKLIIDQDSFGPGGSNLQSILMALQSPDVDLLGITVESGDGWVDENVAHLLRMLELIGRTDVKVYPGATFPLINSPEASKRREAMFGQVAYKGAWTEAWEKYNSTDRTSYHGPHVIPQMREGAPSIKPQLESAASFLIREVHRYPGEVTIMALAPETNIALAVRLDEAFASLAKEIVLEGASFNPRAVAGDPFAIQFVNTPRNSTNFWFDPEAAHIVLHAPWKRITVIPIDATTNTKLTEAVIQKAAHSAGTPQSPVQKYVEDYANRDFPMWDEAAFAVWLNPALVLEHDSLLLDIDTNPSGSNYGGTLSWPPGKGPGVGEATVEVVRAINVPQLETLFTKLISRKRE